MSESLANASAWPIEPKWRAFAAKIADGVTQHLHRGGKIKACTEDECGLDCRCPLGALMSCAYPFPGPGQAAEQLKLPIALVRGFIHGFDGNPDCGDRTAYRLGQEYRRRFVEGAAP